MSLARKPTLINTLSDPKNRQVSAKFFKFSFLLVSLPIGFLLGSIKGGWLSVQSAGIMSVVIVNTIIGIYAALAYKEEVADWNRVSNDCNKKNS